MKLIVGLGNPEEKYQYTRHNLGFLAIDHFVKKFNLGEWELNKKLAAEVIKVHTDQFTADPELVLIRPQTAMNLSGLAVARTAAFFKIRPEDVVIIYDDVDLLLGHIKLRLGGGFAGHHGVESVLKELKTDQFARLKLGIGNTRSHSTEKKRVSFSAERFVLEEFLPDEQSGLKKILKKATEALETLLDLGFEKAQNQYN